MTIKQGRLKCIKCTNKGDNLYNVPTYYMKFLKYDYFLHQIEGIHHIQLKNHPKLDGQEQQTWRKREPQSQTQEEPKDKCRSWNQTCQMCNNLLQYHIINEGVLPSRPNSIIGTNIFGHIQISHRSLGYSYTNSRGQILKFHTPRFV